MGPTRIALTAFILFCSASGAVAIGPAPLVAQIRVIADARPQMLTPVRLCNGISKHTRTICCGTHPPLWCGKRPDASDGVFTGGTVDRLVHGPANDLSVNELMSILRDPMLYLCMLTCVSIIFLAALAGSGRDVGTEEAA